jgi:hypothetical protein
MNCALLGHTLVALLKYVYSELRSSWGCVTTTVLLFFISVRRALRDDGSSLLWRGSNVDTATYSSCVRRRALLI